ncbi:MAG: helix-turn-helix transcriptional regulator [Candidatus Eisenbacteria bacterium]|nr:helix-turn-helix transcriptional regulator [Candidatus Eisenbacteria bacterium]
MKRKSLDMAQCPIARTLDVIGDWWSLLIVRDALLGKRRFGEFQKSLGLAKNILSTRLRKLVLHGVLEVGPASDGSAYQEYALTEKGRGLYIVLVALRQWGETCLFKKGELELLLVDQRSGQPVQPLELRAKDGRILGPEDLGMVGPSD